MNLDRRARKVAAPRRPPHLGQEPVICGRPCSRPESPTLMVVRTFWLVNVSITSEAPAGAPSAFTIAPETTPRATDLISLEAASRLDDSTFSIVRSAFTPIRTALRRSDRPLLADAVRFSR